MYFCERLSTLGLLVLALIGGQPLFAQTAQGADSATSAGSANTINYGGKKITLQQAQAMNIASQALEPINHAQWQQALEILNKALALDPDCVSALLNAGLCYNQIGNFKEGVKDSLRVTQLAPERLEAWVNLGSGYQGAGQYADAIRTYEAYLTRFSNPPHADEIRSLLPNLKAELARQKTVLASQTASASGSADPGATKSPASSAEADYLAYSSPEGLVSWAPGQVVNVYIPSDEEAKDIPGYTPDLSKALKAAFQEWSAGANGLVNFKYVPRAQDADIECRWVADPSQVAALSEGGDASMILNSSHHLEHVKISLLTRTTMSADPVGTLNTIRAVALHEVGHSLGITGHSPNSQDIMFASVTDTVNQRHLTQRDLNTLLRLYRTDVSGSASMQPAEMGGDRKLQLNNQASVLIQSKDFAGATKKLEEALKLDPNFKLTRVNLAVCLTNSANKLAQSGKTTEATAQYKRALDLLKTDSDNHRKAMIMKNYAAVLYNTNHAGEAKQMEAEARRLLGGNGP